MRNCDPTFKIKLRLRKVAKNCHFLILNLKITQKYRIIIFIKYNHCKIQVFEWFSSSKWENHNFSQSQFDFESEIAISQLTQFDFRPILQPCCTHFMLLTLTEFSFGHHLTKRPRRHPISHKWLNFLQFSYSCVLMNPCIAYIVPLVCLTLKASNKTICLFPIPQVITICDQGSKDQISDQFGQVGPSIYILIYA